MWHPTFNHDLIKLLTVMGSGVVILALVLGTLLKARRLKTLDEALRSGVIDAQTKQQMLVAVVGRPRTPWLYSVGWVGLFVGIAMLASDNPPTWAYEFGMPWWNLALLVFGTSLGIVTLPFAVRELQSRRPQVTGTRN